MSGFTLQQDFLLALGAIFLIWFGVVLYVVVTRAINDARESLVERARTLVERRADEVLASRRAARLDPILRRLPRRTIERIAADTATPPATARVFSQLALDRGYERLLRRARRHGTEATRWRRVAALRILATAGWAVTLPLLERALADGDEELVNAAVAVLGTMRSAEAGPLLVRALEEGRCARSLVASQIDASPADLTAPLRELVHAHDPEVRRWVAALLARSADDPEVTLDLAVLCGDPDPNVRAAAVKALAGVSTPPVAAAALALLGDDVWFVRAQAARTLAAFRRPDFAGLLAELLADEEWWVRTAAKQALESLGDVADRALLRALGHEDAFARNSAAEVLQNRGVIDELIRRAVADPTDRDALDRLHRIFAAGGERLVESSLSRVAAAGAEPVHHLRPVAPSSS